MKPAAIVATTIAGGLLLSGCGLTAKTNAATPSPSPSGSRRGFNRGAAGELVKIGAGTLTLNTAQGDVTVAYTSGTTVINTRTGAFADIAVGRCILATGSKDAGGAVTAAQVRLSDKVNGACSAAGGGVFFGGGGGGGGGGFGGPPGGGPGGDGGAPSSPRPLPSVPANVGFARGEVTAISGTAVTVKDPSGTSSTITIPTTAAVTVSSVGAIADLTIGACVRAAGARDSSGTVTAMALTIQPAGPSGCFTGGGGFGRFGGGGGGGFGGGGGGGGFGGGGGGGGFGGGG